MAAAAEQLFQGLALSISSGDTAARIQNLISETEWGKELKALKTAAVGFNPEYHPYITRTITEHADSDLPIILTFDRSRPADDPRTFAFQKDDYVIVFTNGDATPINTSAMPRFYRVRTVDDTYLTVYPADHLTNPLKEPRVLKTRCALLRKHIVRGKPPRLIIMVLNYIQLPNGGAKSSRRRKRRPSRSKSVNKKRKYTQQRVRRRSHRR